MTEAPNTRGDVDLDASLARHLGFTLWKREPCLVFKQEGTLLKLPLFPGGECRRGDARAHPTERAAIGPSFARVGPCGSLSAKTQESI